MDISESLKITENSIRDTISFVLTKKFGSDWVHKSGLSSDRICKWLEKQKDEEKKLQRCDPRIIYYADFYDLFRLIKINWEGGLCEVFEDLKEIDVLLKILGDLRNPEAHRRQLLSHEKNLAIGIAGKIRSTITRYFSKMDTGESYYPRIECIQDGHGTSWFPGTGGVVQTGKILRVGEVLEFAVSAFDPLGETIEYAIQAHPTPVNWQEFGDFSVTIGPEHVQKLLWIVVGVRSKREFHATAFHSLGKVDAFVQFGYEVLPPR